MNPNKHMGDLLTEDAPEKDIQNAAMNRLVGRGLYYHINPGSGHRSALGSKRGEFRVTRKQMVAVDRGDIVIKQAVPFNSGAPEGYPDVSGGTQYVVKPEDVGRTILVFTGLEAKDKDGRLREAQGPMLDAIARKGGIAGLFRTPQQALDIVDEWHP